MEIENISLLYNGVQGSKDFFEEKGVPLVEEQRELDSFVWEPLGYKPLSACDYINKIMSK